MNPCSPLSFSSPPTSNSTPKPPGDLSTSLSCRICLEGDDKDGALVSPCGCSGTASLVHQKCLEKWLSIANRTHCELCEYEFRTHKRTKGFGEWLGPVFRRPFSSEYRALTADCLCCCLLLCPIALISMYFCILGGLYFFYENDASASAGLFSLAAFCAFVIVAWCLATVLYHIKQYRRWRAVNQSIRLTESLAIEAKI